MACNRGRKLQAYLDGDLSQSESARLEEHLAACRACRAELAQLRQLERLLLELSPAAPPPALAAETLGRVRRELRPIRRPQPIYAALTAGAGVAVAFLLLVVQLAMRPPLPPVPASSSLFARAIESRSPTATLARTHNLPRRVAAAPAAVPDKRPRPRLVPRYRPTLMVAAALKQAPVTETAPAAVAMDRVAAAALKEAKVHASGDPDLTVAALENVALAYPKSQQAAQALLSAADLERQRGNVGEADVAYRRVLSLPSGTRLTQALAHKALGDLRRESVGDDEVALYHYRQAARALRAEAGTKSRPDGHALVVLADIEKTLGQHHRAAADYATAANAAPRSTGELATDKLAEVL